MNEQADRIVVQPSGPVRASIIWLHGLGADGHDFEPVVSQLRLAEVGVRVTLPHAPMRPVTINGGYVMRAWYDVMDVDLTRNPDAAGIRESSLLLEQLIRGEIDAGIPSQRIVLAGFSQGGAIVLHCGLRYSQSLAGIIALSTYLPLPDTLADETHKANQNTPIFMGHGEIDPIVPAFQGRRSAELLESMGYRVEFHGYPMPHSVCPQELLDFGGWLAAVLGV